MTPENCIKVKRDGPRGWHWIAADKFDPALHELADVPARDPLDHDGDVTSGVSVRARAARTKRITAGSAAGASSADVAALNVKGSGANGAG